MKHKHTIEVNVPPTLQEKVDRTRDHLQVNKKAYLFGFGGVAIGVVGTRIFSRPPVTQVIVHANAAAADST